MTEMIRVLLIEPGEKPRLVTVEHTLKNLQELVGGNIQVVYPSETDPIGLVCDDEALFKGYPPNRLLEDEEGNPYDVLKGTFFVVGLGKEDFASISDEMVTKYTERFYWPEMFMRIMDDHVIWIKMKPGEYPRMIC